LTTTPSQPFRNSFAENVKNLDWLAGFFDGEGCIYLKEDRVRSTIKGKEYHSPDIQVIVAQSGEQGLELMEAIQSEYNFGKITTAHGSSFTKKTPYMARTTGKNAIKFLKLITPHLVLKKNKALEAISLGEKHFGE